MPYGRRMKLLVIWLLGVPLAVAAMCTAAAFWPRNATADAARATRPVVSAPGVARQLGQQDVKGMFTPVRP